MEIGVHVIYAADGRNRLHVGNRLNGLGSQLLRHSLLQDVQGLAGSQAGLHVALHPLLGAGGKLLETGRLKLLGNRLNRLEAGYHRLLELGLHGVNLLSQLVDLLPGLRGDLGDLLQFLSVKALFLRHALELGPDVRIRFSGLQLLGDLLVGALRLFQLLAQGANLIQPEFDLGNHVVVHLRIPPWKLFDVLHLLWMARKRIMHG